MPTLTPLQRLSSTWLPAIEEELRKNIGVVDTAGLKPFARMLDYHMGWSGSGGARAAGGKRIRPLLALLACQAAGGSWRRALPAAAALEIVHNFSLVHDDIQDASPTRRGRAALWTVYGTPLAINAGDALLTIANLAILNFPGSTPAGTVQRVARILQVACLDLTRGQYLDLSQQEAGRATLRRYWSMIDGKTAALLSACTEIGAALGGASKSGQLRWRKFGRLLGAAFQVQDDILGIWGEETLTGKSAATDLAEGKLSLPVVYGLRSRGAFAAMWGKPHKGVKQVAALKALLEQEGGLRYSVRQSRRLTKGALTELAELHPQGTAGTALEELVHQLLARSG